MDTVELPLFPLDVVLVPGAHLPLRIFERRYLDMVRECTAENKPFGVVLVVRRNEPGEAASHVRIGTEARIRDFNTLEDGLLGVSARGERRFEVMSTSARHDGLLLGTLRPLDPEPPIALPARYGLLADIVDGFMNSVGTDYPCFESPDRDNAAWVSYRLTELLPLDNAEKQALLELRDPLDRLQALVEILPRFQADATDE
jgi:Lon protease-like protein